MMDGNSAFEDFVGLLDYPMFIVTAYARGDMGGCLVGFATQASITPPIFLVGLSHPNHTLSVAHQATHLGVHLVARENIELCRLFGGQTNDAVNKFDFCAWHMGPKDTPILDAAEAWFVGAVVRRLDMGGDHVGYLLKPLARHRAENPRAPVSFDDVKDLEPGHRAQAPLPEAQNG